MEGGEVEGRNSATKAPTHLPTHNGTLRQRKYMEDTKSETRASFLIYLSKRRQQYSRKCVCWCWCVGMCVCKRAREREAMGAQKTCRREEQTHTSAHTPALTPVGLRPTGLWLNKP